MGQIITRCIEHANGTKQVCVRSWFALHYNSLDQPELLAELEPVFSRQAINGQQPTEIHF